MQPWHLLVVILASWINRHQQAVIDFQGAQIQVLMEKLGRKRILLNDDQRRRLAVKGKILGRKALRELALVPFLLWVRKTNPTPGATAARFIFWYAFMRIFIDLFRDYPTHRFDIGTGQTLNILMAMLGVIFLVRSRLRRLGRLGTGTTVASRRVKKFIRPSDW